jgi:hypothetical protein
MNMFYMQKQSELNLRQALPRLETTRPALRSDASLLNTALTGLLNAL